MKRTYESTRQLRKPGYGESVKSHYSNLGKKNLIMKIQLIGVVAMIASGVEAQSVSLGANGWSNAYYNFNGHVGGFVQLAAFGNPSGSATPDTTGLATSAYVNVAGSGSGYPHDPNTYDIISATGDLSSVKQTMSEFDTGTNDFYTGDDGGTTFSQLNDNLTFAIGGANGSTTTLIGYTRTVSGHLRQSGSSPGGHGELSATWNLNGAGAGGNVDIQLQSSSGFQPFINGSGGSGSYVGSTPDLIVQTGSFTIIGTSLNTDFSMDQSSWAYNGMDENYTQTFSFTMPTNVTLTSRSGVFGSAAVPEPSSILCLAGLSLVALRRKKTCQAR
jgi:hypothetical protein